MDRYLPNFICRIQKNVKEFKCILHLVIFIILNILSSESQIILVAMSLTKIQIQIPAQRCYKPRRINLDYLQTELTGNEDPLRALEIISAIFTYIKQAQGIQFQTSLHSLLKLFQKGYANHLTQEPELLKKIMSCFVLLFNMFEKQPSLDVKYRMLFVLSILAEFSRQQPNYLIPFDRKFIQKVFEIEYEAFCCQEERTKLLAILGVICTNLTKQSKLIRELKIQSQLKQALLQNYGLIEQLYTLKHFNQCIMLLQVKKLVIFTLCELQKYRIKETILKTIPERQAEVVLKYMNQLFPRSNKDKQPQKQ